MAQSSTTISLLQSDLIGSEGEILTINVSRTGDLNSEETIQLTQQSGTANLNDLVVGEAHFNPGESEATITVTIKKDGLWEGKEKIELIAKGTNNEEGKNTTLDAPTVPSVVMSL